jgi:hypothetical protein
MPYVSAGAFRVEEAGRSSRHPDKTGNLVKEREAISRAFD